MMEGFAVGSIVVEIVGSIVFRLEGEGEGNGVRF